jgi:hypothetical protein
MTIRKNVLLAKDHLKSRNPAVSIVGISSIDNADLVYETDPTAGGQAYPFAFLLASPKRKQVYPAILPNIIHSFQDRHEA